MTHNDSIMNHCPHCDSLCLLSQSEVDTAQAANKAVAITCHQCNAQFGLEHNCPTGTKPARRAEMKIVNCPSCKMAITIPTRLSGDMKIDLFCPLCDNKIQQGDQDNQAAKTPSHNKPRRNNTSRHRLRRQALLPKSTMIMPASQTATPA
jgi:hypothetical protein